MFYVFLSPRTKIRLDYSSFCVDIRRALWDINLENIIMQVQLVSKFSIQAIFSCKHHYHRMS